MELSKESQHCIKEFVEKFKQDAQLLYPMTYNSLRSMVRAMGGNISVLHMKFPDYKSIIKKVGEGFDIEVYEENKHHYMYGCAHSLGHLLLHIGYLNQTDYWKNFTKFEDNYNGTMDEAEADFFAECFLIPDKEFLDYCEKFDSFDRDNFREMAFVFGTPVKDIVRKGIRLGIIDVKNTAVL